MLLIGKVNTRRKRYTLSCLIQDWIRSLHEITFVYLIAPIITLGFERVGCNAYLLCVVLILEVLLVDELGTVIHNGTCS